MPSTWEYQYYYYEPITQAIVKALIMATMHQSLKVDKIS